MPINLYKEKGETPLECLERFRSSKPELASEKMTYAGRLDPLAEGVMIALVGEECKEKEKYLGLDKEYEVDVLMGIETDTYDILGKVTKIKKGETDENFEELLKIFVGKLVQSYPPFSSKTVGGKPLFALAKSGELDEVEIPTKEIEIYSIKLLEKYEISVGNFLAKISDDISRVKGDFRQKEIFELWQKTLTAQREKSVEPFQVIKILVSCSSGTYMRSLAYEIGKKVGTGALALNIIRTKVGKYEIK
ncbi:MAG: hypothetical protein PHV93_01860 [Candidatus Pacebacteria bacterium]|nr:hypothetical protein [Candidatus Paceibacterota bacterium]